MQNRTTIIYLMGPTASGKTRLAIDLTQHLPVEIISVDSALVYRDMNIGTAKPSPDELAMAPHRLIDICDPAESYSVGQFCEDANTEIQSIVKQNKIPLLVGGTMLYFYALQNGLASLPTADAIIRQAIAAEAEAVGWPNMYAQLATIDPNYAAVIHPHDSQRIGRALEVYRMTGEPISQFHKQQASQQSHYQIIPLILAPTDRKVLHARIETRFKLMLAAGFVDEVQRFFAREDLHANLSSMRTVGYRQIWRYLAGECDYETMREKAIIATRQLAKRQLTWLRRWQDASWYDSEQDDIKTQVISYLNQLMDR